MGPSCLLLLLCLPFCCAVLFGRPHIIFIMADDLGWNDVSFHGSDQIPTPNIDSLAFNGVILNSHYSQSTCTASRAALMTGRYPVHLGMQGASLLSAEPRGLPPGKILPEYLRELGYTNRAVGKWNLGFYKRELTPTYRGFDSHLGYWTNHVSYYDYIHQSQSKDDELNGFDLRHNLSLAKHLAGSYVTDVFTDEAVRIISTHGITEPLFLYVAHQAPHAGNKGKLLEAPQEVINQFSHIADPNRRTYAAMVSKLDESVGRIMGALQRKGMLGDSIIVFISDNGAPTKGESPNWGSNYPLRGIKDTLWEGGVRVLGLVWSPLLQQTPRVSNQVMHVTDWLPTLYTAAGGIPPLNGLDGVDQWDAIAYNLPSQRTEVLININEKKRTAAIRFQNYKLIIGSSGAAFDKHFGETWTTSSSPPCNYSAITKSKAGTAIAELYRSLYRQAASALQLPYIRSEATLLCTPRNPGFSCDPAITKQSCLYDVEHDPCETDNIAETYPDMVQHLRGLLVRHRQSLVPQSNLPTAPFSANPSIWGNIWTTWGSGGELTVDNLRNAPGTLYPLECDLTKEEDILSTFDWIKRNLGGVDILVNNAGSGDYQTLLDGKTEGWQKQIDLGIIGVSICTREAIKSMRERQVDDGHIININSVRGHALSGVPLLIMNSAIKHGLTVLTEGLRRELVASGSKIRVTSISPGLVRTEATLALEEHLGDTLIKDNPQLAPKDIADAILFCLGAPAHVQIHELTIRPAGEKF